MNTAKEALRFLAAQTIGIRYRRDFSLIKRVDVALLPALMTNFRHSKSQLRQDLFVLSQLGFKRNGFFVEFGATNGIDLSNTYLLEKRFGWAGILAEPAKCWQSDLARNRKSVIESACVWHTTGEVLEFNQVDAPELSTLSEFNDADIHGQARRTGLTYAVPTISLNDLLAKHNAPSAIDYLSIDTEGSEYEILKGFDFTSYRVSVITCEHNFTTKRDAVYALLSSHGYRRIYEDISLFDDWYILA
jgi:FkbM family methyltransferase